MTDDQLYPEQAVLGAALNGPMGYQGLLTLDAGDYVTSRHRRIALALKAIINRGQEPDPIILLAELQARGQETGPDSVQSNYLWTLQGAVPVPANGWFYAVQVREATRVRASAGLAAQLTAASAKQEAGANLDELLSAHSARIAAIPAALDQDADEIPTITDLFKKEFVHRELVPGLVSRRDRIVITGAEGLSKSTTCTQWAICLAAGLHPWTGESIGQGLRVLLVDTENDEEQTQHRYRWVGERINFVGGEAGWANRIYHQIRPEGLDLVGKDRVWLSRLIGRASPDIVIMGPAYKLIGAAKTNDDASILAFFAVIDQIRVEHDTAFMIEAHTGHAKDGEERALRPFGSSVWMRWPEVGIGLRRNAELDTGEKIAKILDVIPWRGMRRGDTNWPDKLRRGNDSELPWVPFREDYWSEAARAKGSN